jgi:hypothetical protein
METVNIFKTCTIDSSDRFDSQHYEKSERFGNSILILESDNENLSNGFKESDFRDSEQLIHTETIEASIWLRLTDKHFSTIWFNPTSLHKTASLCESTFFSSNVLVQSEVFTASEYLLRKTADADRQSSTTISLSLANGLLAVVSIVIIASLLIFLVKRRRHRSTKTFDASLENSHELDHTELNSDDSYTEELGDMIHLSWNASSCDSLFTDGDEIFSHEEQELF